MCWLDEEQLHEVRTANLPGHEGELFFGYYVSAATVIRDENGPAVPELARRMTLSSCHLDPFRAGPRPVGRPAVYRKRWAGTSSG